MYLTFSPETLLGAYGPMLNIALSFLLISVTLMIATFAYKKYYVKEFRETKRMDEAEGNIIKTEKEKEKARPIEETGYSERDEREEHDNDDSDDDGE